MKQYLINLIFLSIISVFAFSCARSLNKQTQKPEANSKMNEKTTAGPPVLIYKTKQDYFQNVPVVLNEDKTSVVSFPAISDLMRNNAFTYPTLLENEFLLDNRGIAKNTAFITLTYEEYSRLEKTPTVDEILKLILDNDPFVVLYNCGSRYNYDDILSELNLKITTNKLNEFKKLK